MHSPLIFWELCVSCVQISPLYPYVDCAFQPVHFESISRWVAISWSGKFAESYALSRLRMHMLALFSCGILKGSLPVFSWVCYTHAVSYFTFYSWVDYVKKTDVLLCSKKKLMFFYEHTSHIQSCFSYRILRRKHMRSILLHIWTHAPHKMQGAICTTRPFLLGILVYYVCMAFRDDFN